MRGFDVRLVRLVVAAGAIVGSALVTSVAVAADDPPMIDESVLVTEIAVTDPSATIATTTEPSDPPEPVEPVKIDENVPVSTEPVSIDENDPPFDDIATIEIVALESGPGAAGTAEPATVDLDENVSVAADMEDDTPADDDATDPDAGHEGATGGQGNPYRMTFTVVWLDPTGTPIAVLDTVLPTDWRSVFTLWAASRTGMGMPTSATCAYPAGSDVLQCTFVNPGHGSGTEGLVVPARPTARYQVGVVWPASGWTIDGADADANPYSARELCPRGGEGGEEGGGHEGGGEEGGGEEGGGGHEGPGGGHEGPGAGHEGPGGTFWCEHTVVFQQLAAPPTDPPVVDPEEEAESLPPTVTPAVQAPAATPAVASGSLAATGGSISMILVIAGLLIAAGSALAGLSRRTS